MGFEKIFFKDIFTLFSVKKKVSRSRPGSPEWHLVESNKGVNMDIIAIDDFLQDIMTNCFFD